MLTGQLILIFQAFLQSNHRKSAQLPMVQQTSSKLPSCRCCVYPPFVDDFPRIKNMAFWHLCKRFKQNPTFVHFRVPAVLGEQGFWKGLHLLQSCCPAEIQGPLNVIPQTCSVWTIQKWFCDDCLLRILTVLTFLHLFMPRCTRDGQRWSLAGGDSDGGKLWGRKKKQLGRVAGGKSKPEYGRMWLVVCNTFNDRTWGKQHVGICW